MRTQTFLALTALTLTGGACKWTDFDDLEAETWVRSTEDPDLGSSDYAVAIAGVSQGTSGGTLAVISDDTANYSTLTYSAKGDASVGANPVKLGTQQIGAVADFPVFVTDATGRIGLVERSISGGNFAVVFGSATAPAAIEFPAKVNPAPAPDAAVFAPGATGNDLVFAAGSTIYTVPAMGGAPIACDIPADGMGMSQQVAALEHDGTDLFVWTKNGTLISFPLTEVSPCAGGSLLTPTEIVATGAYMPAPGARLHHVSGHIIMTGHPMTTRSGSISVIRLSDNMPVGSTITVEGIRTSTIAVIGTDTFLVVGVPDRAVGGVASGEVDLHAFNPATGMLDSAPTLSLHDADPESGQLFGRTVTTMNFNGNPILVVGADSEIFAYYRTALYDQMP